MSLASKIQNQIENCPEYYPYEWFRSCELLLKQTNSMPLYNEIKVALTEYSIIFKVTAQVCSQCKIFEADEQEMIAKKAEELCHVIANILR